MKQKVIIANNGFNTCVLLLDDPSNTTPVSNTNHTTIIITEGKKRQNPPRDSLNTYMFVSKKD